MLLQKPFRRQAVGAPQNDTGAAPGDLSVIRPAPMRILICGSFYFAGAILARNG
jgi:hypothetical protein